MRPGGVVVLLPGLGRDLGADGDGPPFTSQRTLNPLPRSSCLYDCLGVTASAFSPFVIGKATLPLRGLFGDADRRLSCLDVATTRLTRREGQSGAKNAACTGDRPATRITCPMSGPTRGRRRVAARSAAALSTPGMGDHLGVKGPGRA